MPNFGPIYPVPLPTPWYLATPQLAATANVGSTTLNANSTHLESVWVPTPMTLTSAAIGHGAVHAGNLDLGLYDQNGNLLGHTGVIAATAGSQTANLLNPIVIGPGLYFMGMWVDNATDTYFCLTGEGPALDYFLASASTNAGGLASTFAGMGGTAASTIIVPFLFHIQGTGF